MSESGTIGERFYSPRLFKIGLSIGFVLLFVGIMAAYNNPATGREVSIYTATPGLFWIGVGAALIVSIVVSAYVHKTYLGSLAVLQAGTSVLAVIALPLIRNYRYYGLSDSLTHLGWAREIVSGQMIPETLIYPAAHLLAGGIATTTTLTLTRAMMLTVFLYGLVFVLFIPLSVRALTRDRRATLISAFSALLLLPITNISTHLMFHPFTMTTLFVPLALFLLFKHVLGESNSSAVGQFLSQTGVVMAAASAALVIFHPQTASDVLILYITIASVQWILRRRRPDHPLARLGSTYGQAIFMAIVFLAWNLHHPTAYDSAENLLIALENTFLEQSDQIGKVIIDRGETAQRIQVSLFELFVKLFLVSAVYTFATVVFSLNFVRSRLNGSTRISDGEAVTLYLIFAGIVLMPYFLSYLSGNVSSSFFRHVGFAMVIITILGSLAFRRWASLVPLSPVTTRSLAVVGVAVVLVLSLLVVFPSPYIYKRNHQVTDQQMEGYETFYGQVSQVDRTSENSVSVGGIRSDDDRFRAALLYNGTLRYTGPVPESAIISGLPTYYLNHPKPAARVDHYLPVTDAMYVREVIVAEGYRYSAKSFAALRSQWGVHKVHSNGAFTNYYVDVSLGTPHADATETNATDATPTAASG